jgi:signal recognition particle subunit SRP14
MVLLEPDAFLTQLTRIINGSKSKGTMYVTMKRYDPPGAAADAPADTRCLVRAVGAKKKISTMIHAKDYRRFTQSYGNILKVSLDSLKKKEKKKGSDKKGATKAS